MLFFYKVWARVTLAHLLLLSMIRVSIFITCKIRTTARICSIRNKTARYIAKINCVLSTQI